MDFQEIIGSIILQKAVTNISRGSRLMQRCLRSAIYAGDSDKFLAESLRVCDTIKNAKAKHDVEASVMYIKNNMEFISQDNRCSAEGHVSHVLSARLSSRPMAWSKDGAERMAKLRAYMYNNGNFVDLVKYGKMPPVTKNEYVKPCRAQPECYTDGIAGSADNATCSVVGLSACGSELARKLKLIINN